MKPTCKQKVFHPGKSFNLRINRKRVFTCKILSWDETRPRMKSSFSMVKCLLLFTQFCQDEILSLDELIPVKKTGMKFHPGMKKGKKDL